MEFLEIGKSIVELGTTTIIIAAVIYLLIKYFSNLINNKIEMPNTSKSININYLSVVICNPKIMCMIRIIPASLFS